MAGASVWRPTRGELIVKVDGGRDLIKKIGPTWRCAPGSAGYWKVARGRLRELVDGLAAEVGECEVFVDFRASVTFKCDKRCVGAVSEECLCSCLGRNHRGTQFGWFEVGETTLLMKAGQVRRQAFRVTAADVAAGISPSPS